MSFYANLPTLQEYFPQMILVALGSNLASAAGLPAQTLNAAITTLENCGIRVAARSSYYVTPAWPDPSDPPFVNAVIAVDTSLEPDALLERLHATETALGRVRSARNAPRTLDLDLLDYDGRIAPGPPVLPHPRIAERAFVLVPLAEVAPDWTHPETGTSVGELLSTLPEADRRAVVRVAN